MNAFACIGFVALSGFGVWLLYGARELIRLGLASYKWSKTEGTIIESRHTAYTVPGIDSTSTGVVPVEHGETVHDYVYEVSGRMYRCDTYSFGGWADNATAAYAVGTKVAIYYDPEHPETAVLRRGIRFGAVFGVVPIAAGFLWILLWMRV